jgi:hypothetical protein
MFFFTYVKRNREKRENSLEKKREKSCNAVLKLLPCGKGVRIFRAYQNYG